MNNNKVIKKVTVVGAGFVGNWERKNYFIKE